MQLGYKQISNMNKDKEFWKSVQTTFFRITELSYMQDKDHLDQIRK